MRGLIVGTGPSLRGLIEQIPRFEGRLFILNNTWREPWVEEHWRRHEIPVVWIACDERWHEVNGPQDLPDWVEPYHFDREICRLGGYRHIEGVWHNGLWLEDCTKISLNHGSAPQAINLACHYECDPIVLVGHDFDYPPGQPRHYFDDLSDRPGEYPEPLRKYSKFIKNNGQDDLLAVYKRIADTPGRPEIINCTPGSKLPWFPFANFEDFCGNR